MQFAAKALLFVIGDLKDLPFQHFVQANARAHPLNPSFANRKLSSQRREDLSRELIRTLTGAQAASKFLLTYVLNYEYRWVIGIAFWSATLTRFRHVLIRSISSRLCDATTRRLLPVRHFSRPLIFPAKRDSLDPIGR